MLFTIIANPIEAVLTRDIPWLGDMDPYCVFVIGKKKFESETCKNGGKNPFWEDEVVIIGKPIEDTIYVEIRNRRSLRSVQIVGVAKINLAEYELSKEITKWHDVLCEGKIVGQVLIEMSVIRKTVIVEDDEDFPEEKVVKKTVTTKKSKRKPLKQASI